MSREQWVLDQLNEVTGRACQGRGLDPADLPAEMEEQLRDAIRNVARWVEHELGPGVVWRGE